MRSWTEAGCTKKRSPKASPTDSPSSETSARARRLSGDAVREVMAPSSLSRSADASSLPLDARVPLVQQESGGCQAEGVEQARREFAEHGLGRRTANLAENPGDANDHAR